MHVKSNFYYAFIVVNTEQMESDVASARETLADASSGIDKMRQELRSLAAKVAKGEVRI